MKAIILEIIARIDIVGRWINDKIERLLAYYTSPSGSRLFCYQLAQACMTFISYPWVKIWENAPETMRGTTHPFIWVCMAVNIIGAVAVTTRSFLDQSKTKQQEGGYEHNESSDKPGMGPTPINSGSDLVP